VNDQRRRRRRRRRRHAIGHGHSSWPVAESVGGGRGDLMPSNQTDSLAANMDWLAAARPTESMRNGLAGARRPRQMIGSIPSPVNNLHLSPPACV